MTWPPDPSYTPPAPTDCTGGNATGGLSTGDRLHQVPVGRLFAHDQISTLPTRLQPLDRPLSGVVPGLFGATCRCEQLAEPVGDGSLDSGNWGAPLGAVGRLSPERSVWIVCTNGWIWGAVVQHSPMSVGPWHKLVLLQSSAFQYDGIGGVGGALPLSPGVVSPGLAVFSNTRIVVIHFEYAHVADDPPPHDTWATYHAVPFDVAADGSFTEITGGGRSVTFTTGSFIDQPPQFVGRFTTCSSTMAVKTDWDGRGVGVMTSVPWQYGRGIMAVTPTGILEISSESLALESWPGYTCADLETGQHLYLGVEQAGPVVGGFQSKGLFASIIQEVDGGFGSRVPHMTHRTNIVAATPCIEITAPPVRLSRGRFLVAIRRLGLPDIDHPSGVVNIRQLVVLNVGATPPTGLIPVEATFDYPDTPWGIDQIFRMEDADGTPVAYFSTLEPFSSHEDHTIVLENHRAFGVLSVLLDRVELPAAWAPDVRTVALPGDITSVGYTLPEDGQLVMSPVSPGVAAAAWNIGASVNVPLSYILSSPYDPLAIPAVYEPEDELCFLTGMGGTPSASPAGARLSPRRHT